MSDLNSPSLVFGNKKIYLNNLGNLESSLLKSKSIEEFLSLLPKYIAHDKFNVVTYRSQFIDEVKEIFHKRANENTVAEILTNPFINKFGYNVFITFVNGHLEVTLDICYDLVEGDMGMTMHIVRGRQFQMVAVGNAVNRIIVSKYLRLLINDTDRQQLPAVATGDFIGQDLILPLSEMNNVKAMVKRLNTRLTRLPSLRPLYEDIVAEFGKEGTDFLNGLTKVRGDGFKVILNKDSVVLFGNSTVHFG